MTLRARLALALALLVVMLVLSGLGLTMLVRDSDIEEVDRQLIAMSKVVAAGAQQLSTTKLPLPATALEIPTELYVGGLGADDRVVTYLRPALNPDGVPRVTSAEAAANVVPRGATPRPFNASSTIPDESFRVAVVNRPSGGYIITALPTDRVNAAFRRIIAGIVAAGTALLATLALVAWWVERLGLKPIATITAAADAIAAGDLDRRVEAPRGRTEAGKLARAFNLMVDERQAWEEQLRRFVADASHELRTPLTTIVGVMELHRSGSLPAGPTLDDALRRMDREARRMSALLEDLLLLARLDQGRPLADEPVDLGHLTFDVVADARLTRPERRIRLNIEPIPLLRGDESRLRQVLTNLVANALIHTGEETEIRVSVGPDRGASGLVQDPACLLEVSDDGPGMTTEQAGHVFERFYRVDAGRVRARGGSGLGLSIVRSIVVAHGGHVSVRSAPGQGASFRVLLPVTRHLQETSRPSRQYADLGGSRFRHGAAEAGHGRTSRPGHHRIPS